MKYDLWTLMTHQCCVALLRPPTPESVKNANACYVSITRSITVMITSEPVGLSKDVVSAVREICDDSR